jgi:hypothetical protein
MVVFEYIETLEGKREKLDKDGKTRIPWKKGKCMTTLFSFLHYSM